MSAIYIYIHHPTEADDATEGADACSDATVFCLFSVLKANLFQSETFKYVYTLLS